MKSPLRDGTSTRILIGLFLLVALGLRVYYAYVAKPLLQTVFRLRADVRTAEAELHEVEQTIANEGSLRQLSGQLTSEVERFRTSLPAATELLSVIERLSALANQTGVKIQTIAPQRMVEPLPATVVTGGPGARSGLYRELAIQIEAVAGLHQLGTFFSRIESSPQPVQVPSLHITQNAKDPRRHAVKLTLVGFFSTS